MKLPWQRALSAETLASAYRRILGRQVEPAELGALSEDCRRHQIALYDHLLASDEFRQRVAVRAPPTLLDIVQRQYFTMQDVETEVDNPAVLDRLMDRTIGQWRAHGEKDPVWSITTRDEHRAETMSAERLEDFYTSGTDALALIAAFEKRAGRGLRGGTCLELGAGVGRCTEHLASIFDKVIAVDISPGILDVCRTRMRDRGLTNVVDIRLLTRPSDLTDLAPFDLFFSTAVLQHNAPPIQRLLLQHALAGLAANGVCLFQTLDRLDGYYFSAEDYLDSPVYSHDLHCFPKRDVLRVIAETGMTVLDVVPDGFSLQFGSYTYLAQK